MVDEIWILDCDEGHASLARPQREVREVGQRVAQQDTRHARSARGHLLVAIRRLHEEHRGGVGGERPDGRVRGIQPGNRHEPRADNLAGDEAIPASLARGGPSRAEQVRRELRRLEHDGGANLTLGEDLHGVSVDAQRPPQRRGSAVKEVGEQVAVILRGPSRALRHRAHAQRPLLSARQVISELAGFVRDVTKLLARSAPRRERRRVRGGGEHPERGRNLRAGELVPRGIGLGAQGVDAAGE